MIPAAIQGRHPNGCVHPNEVIPRNPERYACLVIRQLAAVCVGSAHEAAKMHSDAEVQSFDMASADKTRLGVSASDTWDRTRHPTRGTKPVRPDDIGAAVAGCAVLGH